MPSKTHPGELLTDVAFSLSNSAFLVGKREESFGFVADRYPVIATELGFVSEDGRGAHIPVIGDEIYGEAIIKYFEGKGISWTPWVFDPQWSPQLIENWDFEPTRQGRLFREKMQLLNVSR